MSTSRRKFLGVVAGAGAGAMVPWRLADAATTAASVTGADATAALVVPAGVTKFAAPGFTPVQLKPPSITPAAGSTTVLPLAESVHQYHPALPPVPSWGYGGASVLGPTIEATQGVPFTIHWRNDLPGTHLLPVDYAMHGADINQAPPVRAVTHLHGGHVPHTVDGGPMAWYTNPLTEPLAPNGQPYPANTMSHGDTYFYPNMQPTPGTLWYHDHAVGITRLNVYAGLAGFYLMRNAAENAIGLPSGDYEIPLAIQDRMFNADGTLYYPPPPHVPEFFGDTFVVNGQVWPRMVVEARKYRFRLLNGCNARFLRMQLQQSDTLGALTRGGATLPFIQVGTDGGLLNAPVTMPELTMGPGERCDVVIDFSQAFGAGQVPKKPRYFLLTNDAATPFSNTSSRMGAIPDVMMFEVRPAAAADTSVLPPADPTRVVAIPQAAVTRVRTVTLEETVDPTGNLMALLNGAHFMDPATETPSIGDIEIWNIVNLTPDTHPMHLHQTMFQGLTRQTFNVAAYNKAYVAAALPVSAPRLDPTPYLTGAARPVDANEMGWKDTIRANPGEVTRIIIRWEGYTGEYVWHCHILEHEDHEMMRPLIVGGAPTLP